MKFRLTILLLLRTFGAYAALAGALASLVWLEARMSSLERPHAAPWESENQKIPLVIVDAGHGGHDGGAVANGAIEKNLTLEIAEHLRDELTAAGLRVIMTREKDLFLPLEQRAALTAQTGAAAFISVHINTDGSGSNVEGIETYFTGRPSLAAARKNGSKSSSEDFAKLVQRHVCQTTTATDRGVKERGYVVIEEATCPALLVECGFLTNTSEAKRLRDTGHQKKIAHGIASGVAQFLQTQQQSGLVATSH